MEPVGAGERVAVVEADRRPQPELGKQPPEGRDDRIGTSDTHALVSRSEW